MTSVKRKLGIKDEVKQEDKVNDKKVHFEETEGPAA